MYPLSLLVLRESNNLFLNRDTSNSLEYGLVSNAFCNIMLQKMESFILRFVCGPPYSPISFQRMEHIDIYVSMK